MAWLVWIVLAGGVRPGRLHTLTPRPRLVARPALPAAAGPRPPPAPGRPGARVAPRPAPPRGAAGGAGAGPRRAPARPGGRVRRGLGPAARRRTAGRA